MAGEALTHVQGLSPKGQGGRSIAAYELPGHQRPFIEWALPF